MYLKSLNVLSDFQYIVQISFLLKFRRLFFRIFYSLSRQSRLDSTGSSTRFCFCAMLRMLSINSPAIQFDKCDRRTSLINDARRKRNGERRFQRVVMTMKAGSDGHHTPSRARAPIIPPVQTHGGCLRREFSQD